MTCLTENKKLRGCLRGPKWTFKLNLNFPRVCPQAVPEEQPAVIGLPHNLYSSSIFDLDAIPRPVDNQSLLRGKGHFESGVLAHAHCQRLAELVKVVRVKFRYVYNAQSLIKYNARE